MRLLIAIPALDEEASIASTIERCLAARGRIVTETEVTAVDVTVVSDGSTDQTVEIAQRYTDQIELIVFKRNRGYGAAIKEAWRRSDAELLGFLDADGTCDPTFFVPLCNALIDQEVDVALGCRRTSESEMPALRRVGNFVFAWLLSALSASEVRDTASGMRVTRRTALDRLYPLPDGLHFTPAMSARVLLADDLRLVEIDMPYSEREGESKLRAWDDGVRFLRVILRTAVLFRPYRLLRLTAVPFLLAAIALLVLPLAQVARTGAPPEGIRSAQGAAGGILLGTVALLIFSGYVAGRIVEVVLGIPAVDRGQLLLRRFFASRRFWFLPPALLILGVAAGIVGQVGTGGARGLYLSVVCAATAVLASVTRLLDRFVEVVDDRLRWERATAPAPAPAPATRR